MNWDDWKDVAEANGISRVLFEQRIKDGKAYPRWTGEEAATTPKQKRRKLFNPWLKLADENGIKRDTYYARVYEYGWTEEEAANKPIDKTKLRK